MSYSDQSSQWRVSFFQSRRNGQSFAVSWKIVSGLRDGEDRKGGEEGRDRLCMIARAFLVCKNKSIENISLPWLLKTVVV